MASISCKMMSLHHIHLLPKTTATSSSSSSYFSQKRYNNIAVELSSRCSTSSSSHSSQFVPPKPLILTRGFKRENKKLLISIGRGRRRNPQQPRYASVVVVALQSNFLRVLQTVWRVGKDGIEAGTNLVPDSVPRPIARISVAGVATAISLFVLKSFVSTVSFVLAMMGLIYFVFIALNKDEGPRGGGGTTSTEEEDDTLEEARRIMEKYK